MTVEDEEMRDEENGAKDEDEDEETAAEGEGEDEDEDGRPKSIIYS